MSADLLFRSAPFQVSTFSSAGPLPDGQVNHS
jgi:hypothetical protein